MITIVTIMETTAAIMEVEEAMTNREGLIITTVMEMVTMAIMAGAEETMIKMPTMATSRVIRIFLAEDKVLMITITGNNKISKDNSSSNVNNRINRDNSRISKDNSNNKGNNRINRDSNKISKDNSNVSNRINRDNNKINNANRLKDLQGNHNLQQNNAEWNAGMTRLRNKDQMVMARAIMETVAVAGMAEEVK